MRTPTRVPPRGVLFRLGVSEHPERRTGLVESVVANLRALLNSDDGCSASSTGFGVSLHQTLMRWEFDKEGVLKQLAQLIERYEPRLKKVAVKELEKGGPLRFRVLISGELADGQIFRARSEMGSAGAADIEQVLAEI